MANARTCFRGRIEFILVDIDYGSPNAHFPAKTKVSLRPVLPNAETSHTHLKDREKEEIEPEEVQPQDVVPNIPSQKM